MAHEPFSGASTERVRIIHGPEVLAEHPRSYDRALRIEDPAHLEAIIEQIVYRKLEMSWCQTAELGKRKADMPGPDLRGMTLADRYRLGELVGFGGSGNVYAAKDLRLRREVAVKVIHPEYARQEEPRRRILQEARPRRGAGDGGCPGRRTARARQARHAPPRRARRRRTP